MADWIKKRIRLLVSGCWEWTGRIEANGYGRIDFGSKGRKSAHRAVYEALVGKIPKGKVIDHLCRNRACVNPGHLEVVTQRENVLRGNSLNAFNAKKTHCKWGHELSGVNLYMRKDRPGRRQCRACNYRRLVAWRT